MQPSSTCATTQSVVSLSLTHTTVMCYVTLQNYYQHWLYMHVLLYSLFPFIVSFQIHIKIARMDAATSQQLMSAIY